MKFLYLRTDICDQELRSGGSVAHTVGVIQGMINAGYSVIVASSCMHAVLQNMPTSSYIALSNPTWLKPLRWKINCLFSSFFFALQIHNNKNVSNITHIYQRYSLLNMTGVLLSWWYKKPLILEYNGSESWIAVNWVSRKKIITGAWLSKYIEDFIICKADYIVVVSEVLQHDLVSKGVRQSKILVNPNGVDAAQYQVK